MTALLVSHHFNVHYGTRVAASAAREKVTAEFLALPADPAARPPDPECARAEIAQLLRVLELKVIGVRRSPRTPDDPVDELHPPQALPELLPRCDWLIITCPLTTETRGLVDAGLLALLPQGARVINVSRGEIVREGALIAALKSSRVAGAYLDVFETEPLPPDSPSWDLPNVLISPHSSGAASGNDERTLALVLDNLGRWHRGAPLLNEVLK